MDAMVCAMWAGNTIRDLTVHASVVGSLRRKQETIGDIDLLVQPTEPYPRIIEEIKRRILTKAEWYRGGQRILSFSNVLDTGIPMQIFLAYPPKNYYALLALRTGPAEDSLRLRAALEARGFPRPHSEIAVRSEQELYELAGLPWIEPTERS